MIHFIRNQADADDAINFFKLLHNGESSGEKSLQGNDYSNYYAFKNNRTINFMVMFQLLSECFKIKQDDLHI